jgi:hypothetical protein
MKNNLPTNQLWSSWGLLGVDIGDLEFRAAPMQKTKKPLALRSRFDIIYTLSRE